MLADDRRRAGWSIERTAWRLGVSAAIYREIEEGARSPAWETWDRICKAFGWQQTFVGPASSHSLSGRRLTANTSDVESARRAWIAAAIVAVVMLVVLTVALLVSNPDSCSTTGPTLRCGLHGRRPVPRDLGKT